MGGGRRLQPVWDNPGLWESRQEHPTLGAGGLRYTSGCPRRWSIALSAMPRCSRRSIVPCVRPDSNWSNTGVPYYVLPVAIAFDIREHRWQQGIREVLDVPKDGGITPGNDRGRPVTPRRYRPSATNRCHGHQPYLPLRRPEAAGISGQFSFGCERLGALPPTRRINSRRTNSMSGSP